MATKVFMLRWKWRHLAILAILAAAGVNYVNAACETWCNEGHCWKLNAQCYHYPQTTAKKTQVLLPWYSLTGGGEWRRTGDLTSTKIQDCTQECADKDYSRATACEGDSMGTEASDLAYCGTATGT